MPQALYQEQFYKEKGTGLGLIVGVILASIIAIMLLAYALPLLRNVRTTSGSVTPDRISVDVNTTPALLQ